MVSDLDLILVVMYCMVIIPVLRLFFNTLNILECTFRSHDTLCSAVKVLYIISYDDFE